MASWAEFAAAMPDMAAAGHTLLYQFGPGLGYLATIRSDGGPRVHPVCPIVAEGDLWLFVLTRSPKGQDLVRDPRYALHTFPKPDVDDEFFVRGTVTIVEDDSTRAAVQSATSATVGADEETLFRCDVERALLSTYETRPQWPPVYTKWADAKHTA